MEKFYDVRDVPDLKQLLAEARRIKQHPLSDQNLGSNKSICLLFLNPSLRTRLSTQKAAFNLGMQVSIFEVGREGWQLEFGDGAVMNGDKAEHIKEAAAVIGAYYDLIAIRSFAQLKKREEDEKDEILEKFIRYSGKPVINMESARWHPLQSFTDLITIDELKKTEKPKVVLTWAPHPRALPQAVPNSFVQWMLAAGHDLVITHPEGYELDPAITANAKIEYDQKKAFSGADFIYAKNWSSWKNYGQILKQDPAWMVDLQKMKLTNQAKFMHCLPVRRNVIMTDEVIDSDNSVVIQQAANRVVAAQTVIKTILER
jgi:N-succinyl-L-ornithine transcarbamylase